MSLALRSSLARPASGPQPIIVFGDATNLTSDTDTQGRFLSFGEQDKEWQTADGVRHAIVNNGALNGANLALGLWSSTNGLLWVFQFALPNTDDFSTGDGVFDSGGTNLWYVYNDNTGQLILKVLHYAAGVWSVTTTETASVTAGISAAAENAQNPGIEIDQGGGVWVGFPTTNRSTGSNIIRLIHRGAGAGSWTNTGNTYGPTDSFSEVQRSFKPITLPGPSMGAVWTYPDAPAAGGVIVHNFAVHPLSEGTNAAWHSGHLYTAVAEPLHNPYGSHFSVVRSISNFAVHIAIAAGGVLLYFRGIGAPITFSEQTLSTPNKCVYPQVSVVNDAAMTDVVLIVVNNQYAYYPVLQFNDITSPLPVAALHTYSLRHLPPTSPDQSWPNPRGRMPRKMSRAFPFNLNLMMTDGALQRALNFEFALV